MFPNPGPAVKAAGRPDTLPAFLFAHPAGAGFFAMLMLAVFGAVAGLFLSFVKPDISDGELFEAGRIGAIIAVMFGGVIYCGVFISALFLPNERNNRLLFFLGGLAGFGVLVALDMFLLEGIRSYLIGNGFFAQP